MFIAENGAARKQKLSLGIQSDTETEVVEGLTEGQEIIVNPPANLKDGDKFAVPKNRT